MSRFQGARDVKTPALSQLSVPSKTLTIQDLFTPEHPVNDKNISGKCDGMSIIIDGHTWVAEGSTNSAGWYRNQKHVEMQTAILRALGNTALTGITANAPLVPAVLDELAPVETFFAGDWAIDSSTSTITYTGEEAIFELLLSGDVSTTDSVSLGNSVTISVYDSAADDGLTGATKTYPVVKVQGNAVTLVDFTLAGYVRMKAGDFLRIEVGSSTTAGFKVDNILWALKPMDALLYTQE